MAAAPNTVAGTTQPTGSMTRASTTATSVHQNSIRWLPTRIENEAIPASTNIAAQAANCHHTGCSPVIATRRLTTTATAATTASAAVSTRTDRGRPACARAMLADTESLLGTM